MAKNETCSKPLNWSKLTTVAPVVNEVWAVLARRREIVGMLGFATPEAGKTTTFRMILGMVTPDSGAVAFDAQDITHLPMYKRARRGIGYLPQERSDFRRLTVWQNLPGDFGNPAD